MLTFTLHSADDKSVRYVAEENITVLSDPSPQVDAKLAAGGVGFTVYSGKK